MSWGERSCIRYGACFFKPSSLTCNVDCLHYVRNFNIEPDSKPSKPLFKNNVRRIKNPYFK